MNFLVHRRLKYRRGFVLATVDQAIEILDDSMGLHEEDSISKNTE